MLCCEELFRGVGSYQAIVPSFGGFSGFCWGSKGANLSRQFPKDAGKGLRYGLAMHLAQNTNLRFVPRIFGLGTMAVGLTATMNNGRDGTGAQITQT